jgi:hypothetical protein
VKENNLKMVSKNKKKEKESLRFAKATLLFDDSKKNRINL